MRRTVARVAFGVFVLVSVSAPQRASPAQSPSQTPPKFVAGVDVVEIDVSVLDKDHKPARALKADDFTVREDGVSQKIVAFDEVYSAPPPPPSAPWIRDVPPDVETNTPAEHNMFAVIIDDALLAYVGPPPPRSGPPGPHFDPYKLKKTLAIARNVIEGLRDDDVASVIFTWDNWSGVNFTSDRSKLLRAVDKTNYGPAPVKCSQWLGSAQSLLTTVEALSTVQHRRKTVFYLSLGFDFSAIGSVDDPCKEQAQGYIYQAMTLAQRTNVNVYTLDPSGLRAVISNFDRRQLQFLQETADNTGGRAIVNTNAPETHVAEILQEARAYYLIGYQLTKRGDDNRFHRIEVKVNRPGVEVHTRSTRFEAPPETRPDKVPPPLESAVGGFLPDSDVRLTMTSAPFANADGTARVELGLLGQLPDPAPGKVRDSVGLAVRVFTTDGRAVTSADQNVPVVLEAPTEPRASGAAPKGPTFGLSSEVSLKPGTYSLRVGVHSTATGKTGSVYSDIVVPDFAKAPLSLSGVLLTESSGSSLRGDALAAMEPTATRTFATDDRIQAFLRIYEGGSASPAAVTVRLRVVDEHNAPVVERAETVPAMAFRDRQADFSYRLPLSTLKPGEYWLSFAAAMGKSTAARDVRFAVR